MAEEGLLIDQVASGSIAAELEIEPGDRLLMINGFPLRDIIDYNFYSSDDELLFLLQKADGELWELEFDRAEGEPVGLFFSSQPPSSCGNNCIFCFVHQLPNGLRKSLYVKDEDYRLSFLHGNYVTLTNINHDEIERIIEQRLSPLYISVHATGPPLRETLLGRNNLPPVEPIIRRLAGAGIVMHTQIVLCPGINDGASLDETVRDLTLFYPKVASLAIVPLGLTRHRKGLPILEPVTAEYAADFVAEWLPKQQELTRRLNGDFLFLADEFFIKAGLDFSPIDTYGELPQLENGVGMIPLFLQEAEEVLAKAKGLQGAQVTVVTGQSAFPYIDDFLRRLSIITAVEIVAVAVRNRLFGEQVTVAGLVCGRDIITALEGKEIGSLLIIPDVMLKEGFELFLDELTTEDIATALGTRIQVIPATPFGLYSALERHFSIK